MSAIKNEAKSWILMSFVRARIKICVRLPSTAGIFRCFKARLTKTLKKCIPSPSHILHVYSKPSSPVFFMSQRPQVCWGGSCSRSSSGARQLVLRLFTKTCEIKTSKVLMRKAAAWWRRQNIGWQMRKDECQTGNC